jgi:hypothetical protein
LWASFRAAYHAKHSQAEANQGCGPSRGNSQKNIFEVAIVVSLAASLCLHGCPIEILSRKKPSLKNELEETASGQRSGLLC